MQSALGKQYFQGLREKPRMYSKTYEIIEMKTENMIHSDRPWIQAFQQTFNRNFSLETIKTEIKYNPPLFFYKKLILVREQTYTMY